jgi:hypothetical protein
MIDIATTDVTAVLAGHAALGHLMARWAYTGSWRLTLTHSLTALMILPDSPRSVVKV